MKEKTTLLLQFLGIIGYIMMRFLYYITVSYAFLPLLLIFLTIAIYGKLYHYHKFYVIGTVFGALSMIGFIVLLYLLQQGFTTNPL